MAHTKQMPRNPNVDRPATAIGSEVQPEGRITSKHKSGETTCKRRTTTSKTPIT